MKKIISITTIVLVCVSMFLFLGCGGTSDVNNNNNNNNNSGGGVYVTGTLSKGTYQTSSVNNIKTFAAADTNTKVFMVDTDTGESFEDSTDASGEYSILIPTANLGDSMMVTIIGADNKLKGPVVIDDNVNGKLGMGMEVTKSVDMDMVIDETKGTGIVTSTNAVVDTTITSVPEPDGTPQGTGENNGGDLVNNLSQVDTLKKGDSDGDGLANVVDSDNDGDGILDGIDSTDTSSDHPTGVYGGRLNVFSNLKIQHEQIDEPSTWQPVITIEFVLDGASSLSDYTSVKVVDGPSWLSSAQIINGGGLWSLNNYELVANNAVNPNRFQVFVQLPIGSAKAGDTLKFEIKKADGTTEYFRQMLNFVFSSPPVVQTIDGTPLNTTNVNPQSPGTTSLPFQVSTGNLSNLTIVWKAPLDEDGNPILGMKKLWNYSIHKISDPNNDESGYLECLTATEDNQGIISYTSDMQTLAQNEGIVSSDIDNIKIDVEADDSVGDNTSHMIRIKP